MEGSFAGLDIIATDSLIVVGIKDEHFIECYAKSRVVCFVMINPNFGCLELLEACKKFVEGMCFLHTCFKICIESVCC